MLRLWGNNEEIKLQREYTLEDIIVDERSSTSGRLVEVAFTSSAATPASMPVPVPNGIITILCWLHNFATLLTSSVQPGHTTRSGDRTL